MRSKHGKMSVSMSCFSPLSLGFRFQLLLWRTKRYVFIDTSHGEVGLYGVSKIQVSSITSERIDPNSWLRCLQKRNHPRNTLTKFEESRTILRGPPETSPQCASMKLHILAKLKFSASRVYEKIKFCPPFLNGLTQILGKGGKMSVSMGRTHSQS